MGFTSNSRRRLELFLLSTVFVCYTASSLVTDKCQNALGMKSLAIPNSAISASSSYEQSIVGPQSARLNLELKGGAWCPKPAIDKDSYEYLQIDLQQLHVITSVETQGRFGNGQGREYTENYWLEYQREDSGTWTKFRNQDGEHRVKEQETINGEEEDSMDRQHQDMD